MSNDERKREDDLVKRLRWKAGAYAKEAANRIEQLAATVEKLEEKNSRLKLDLLLANDVADAAIEGKKELEAKLATCEKYKAEFIRMDRIAGLLADSNDDLEAKLEKALGWFQEIRQHCANSGRGVPSIDERIIERCEDTAASALAELTGGKDE